MNPMKNQTTLRATVPVVVAALAAGQVLPSYAQVTLPSTVQPGRTVPQMQQPLLPTDGQTFGYGLMPLEAPPNADKLYFTLRKVELSGVTAYSIQQLQEYYSLYLGKRINLLTVYQIANQITLKYRAEGYPLARVVVPPQKIDRGVVRLRVLEGFIDKVNVLPMRRNDKPLAGKLPQRMVRQAVHKRPLRQHALERGVLLVNTLPGVRAQTILMAAKDAPGGTDMLVLTRRKRVEGYLQADNRGNRYTGPVQLSAGVVVNGVTGSADALGLQVNQTTQLAEQHDVMATYNRTLTANGLLLTLGASQQGTHPGYTLKPFDVKGRDKNLNVGLAYPLKLYRGRGDMLYGNLNVRDVRSSSLGTVLSKDHIRALEVGYLTQWQDAALGAEWPAASVVDVKVRQGMDALGSSGALSATSRPSAKPNFTKLNVSVKREQVVKRSRWSVYGEASGQLANKKLLTPEQFGVGGEKLGSAYDSSEILGDSGFALRGEVRYLVIPKRNVLAVREAQPYAFYDYGKTYLRNAPAGQKSSSSIASAGVGMRMAVGNGYSVSLEAAKPLSHEVASLNSKHMRFFVNVRKTF